MPFPFVVIPEGNLRFAYAHTAPLGRIDIYLRPTTVISTGAGRLPPPSLGLHNIAANAKNENPSICQGFR
jgi:hypothetical protein